MEYFKRNHSLRYSKYVSKSSFNACIRNMKHSNSDFMIVFQEGKESLGVRMALGETQIVAETREFLIENRVALDSFSQVAEIPKT